MNETFKAPWTPEQVETLNLNQNADFLHPYTCGNRDEMYHDRQNSNLFATENGWVCTNSGCGYTQDWCHAFSAEAVHKLDEQFRFPK